MNFPVQKKRNLLLPKDPSNGMPMAEESLYLEGGYTKEERFTTVIYFQYA